MAASSSKKWAKIISRSAARIYFLIIIFQIPLFRFPCRIGICQSPVEVTASQLISSEVLPPVVAYTLLYPGAFAKAIVKNKAIPSYNNFLSAGKLAKVKPSPVKFDLRHIEVLAGCYLAVAGAFLGLIISGRMSLLGTLLIIWGIAKEIIFGKNVTKDPSKVMSMYSTMAMSVICAFFSVRGDVRKLIRSRKLKLF